MTERRRDIAGTARVDASRPSTYRWGREPLLDRVGVTVLAARAWARERDFDPRFDPDAYEADRVRAEGILRALSPRTTLAAFVGLLVDAQADVGRLRRMRDGRPGVGSDGETASERGEAEKYVACLFLSGTVAHLRETGKWPPHPAVLGRPVLDLLARLTASDFARISGYLAFADRAGKAEETHGQDHDDYLAAFGWMGATLDECRRAALARSVARRRTADRLGPFSLDGGLVREFVATSWPMVADAVAVLNGAKRVTRKTAVETILPLCRTPLDGECMLGFLLAGMALSGAVSPGVAPARKGYPK
jgi:hypothetical protein